MPRAPSASVVLYDAGSQSREVLTFGFEREDFEVYASESAEDARRLVDSAVAPILVISLGTDHAARAEALGFIGSLRDGDTHKHVAIVVLGRRELREEVLRAGADEFVSWPAFIRDAVTLARLALASRGEQGAGLSGLLEDYEVYFLVRALAAASRSAVIELDRGGRKAFLHVAQGALVATRVGRLQGIPAFNHLLLWGEATLRLRFVSPPGERKIEAPVEDLLQAGLKFVTEFERLAARVGGPQATFERRPDRFDKVKIPDEVRRFAETVTSGATLVDLVESSPFKPFDTIKVCYRLSELGLIARRDPVRSISPLTAQLAVRDWLLGTASAQPRSTVTEAGRRAAEAYAEAAAARAQHEPAPSEELFETQPFTTPAPVPAPAAKPGAKDPRLPGGIGAPASTLEDAPTSPREAGRGPSARNKSKPKEGRKQAKAAPYTPAPRPVPPPPKEPPKIQPASIHEAAPKEPVFDAIDEAFFAGEAELHKVQPVDNFDDLDETGRRRRLAKKKKR